jgi:hypothetical protein
MNPDMVKGQELAILDTERMDMVLCPLRLACGAGSLDGFLSSFRKSH